ncbi:hypothetical protein V1477_009906 [Vespula maculifrons]|uniref:Uncharacterized protein n=1 Tax=Vespula maculifrons TaxID=7453 RepID=A0ABD2CB61_VESMC
MTVDLLLNIRKDEEKEKKRRRKCEEKKQECAHKCNGTHVREKQMKFGRKDGHGKEKKRKDRPEQNQSTKIQLDYSVLKEGDPHRSPRPRAHPKGPTRQKI